MNSYAFTLEKYRGQNSRFTCPGCGKRRVFVRYISSETSEYLSDGVGRCNREVECGYHYRPKQYFEDHKSSSSSALLSNGPAFVRKPERQARSTDSLPLDFVTKSQTNGFKNNFGEFIEGRFGEAGRVALNRFYVGTSSHWDGATIFWQVDMRVRAGKVILYNPETCKRIKHPYSHITWIHSLFLKKGILKKFNLSQCLFGEHQLEKRTNGFVGLVESEKTAILATMYLPDVTWMATGSLNGLTPEKLQPIKSHKIILYPDMQCYEKWDERRRELCDKGFRISISSLLEDPKLKSENNIDLGLDIGDLLLKLVPSSVGPLERLH
jgi:hypothetical protein